MRSRGALLAMCGLAMLACAAAVPTSMIEGDTKVFDVRDVRTPADVVGLLEAHTAKGTPMQELGVLLDYVRDNAEKAQQKANDAYATNKAYCDKMIAALTAQVQPKETVFMSGLKMYHNRKEQVSNNTIALQLLQQATDLVVSQLQATGLRMKETIEDRIEAGFLYQEKLQNTNQLAQTVLQLMMAVSNKHSQLTQEQKEGKRITTNPDQVKKIFLLLNLFRHELETYAKTLPAAEEARTLEFDHQYAELNDTLYRFHQKQLSLIEQQKKLLSQNKYLRDFNEVTAAQFPAQERAVQLLQAELNAHLVECENARRQYRRESIERKAQLETLTTVENIVNTQLSDADFLPLAPKPMLAPLPKPVPIKKDADMGANVGQNIPPPPKKPAPPPPPTENNAIIG